MHSRTHYANEKKKFKKMIIILKVTPKKTRLVFGRTPRQYSNRNSIFKLISQLKVKRSRYRRDRYRRERSTLVSGND